MRAAITLALVISLSASAECKKEEFNRYVAAAVRLYEALEYERALDQIGKARESSCGVDDDAALGLYEGIVRSDLGEAEKAKAAFKEALLLKPDAELPLKVSPKVKRQIEALRAEAKKELAPILARQEEERRKKIAEENARAEKARREEEQRRLEDERKAEELRRIAENAKTEEARRRAEDEMRRLEEQRRADEAARARNRPNVVIEKNDRPENRELTANPSSGNDDVASAVRVEARQGRSVKVVPITFAALAVGAGIAGGVLAFLANSALGQARMTTNNQVDRARMLDSANTYGYAADGLFIGTALCGIVAVIALFASPSEPVTEPVK